MGSGGSSGKSSSTSTQEIPGELKPLYSQTGQKNIELQNQLPISEFTNPNPTKVAGFSGLQRSSSDLMGQHLREASGPLSDAGILDTTNRYDSLFSDFGTPLEESGIVQAGGRYFDKSIAPGITNQATLSGLGRSTANTNALAAAEAETMLPLMQGEQSRRDRLATGDQGRRDELMAREQSRRDQLVNQGMAVGDAERQIEQERYNSEAQDALRRQGISEQALFGPMGQLPTTFGQSVAGKNRSDSGK